MSTGLRLALVAALLATAPALAAPHPAFQGVSVDKNIPTFKQKGVVGPIYFFERALTAQEKKGPLPKMATTKITFHQGQPPTGLWDRGYYPCTMGEAMATVPQDQLAKNWAHAVLIWLDGKAIMKGWGDALEEDWKSFNSLGMEYHSNERIQEELANLAPGPHKMTVWHQLNYKAWILGSDGYHFWDDRYIALAKATFDIDVLP